MSHKFQSSLVAAGLLALLALGPQPAAADPSVEPDGRIGCVIRDASGLRFFDGSGRDQKTIAADIVAASQRLGPVAGAACIAGLVRNMTARMYAKLAALYPGQYQPLTSKPLPVSAGVKGGSASQAPTYKYVSLDTLTPSGFLPFFGPVSITEGGHVFGYTGTASDNPVPYIAVYENGTIKPLQPGVAYSGSSNGIVGGAIFLNISTFKQQAAIFRGYDVQLVPHVSGQFSSFVALINDRGTAVIDSSDQAGNDSFFLYRDGSLTPLNFGFQFELVFPTGINSNDMIVGYGVTAQGSFVGFRYDARTGDEVLLAPAPGDHDVFIRGINQQDEIVGASLVLGGVEHVGVWRKDGNLSTFLTGGTPENPAVGFGYSINDRHFIVISSIDQTSTPNPNDIFLVSSPGQFFSMDALLGGVPPDLGSFPQVFGVSNRGKIIVASQDGMLNYLLEPTPP